MRQKPFVLAILGAAVGLSGVLALAAGPAEIIRGRQAAENLRRSAEALKAYANTSTTQASNAAQITESLRKLVATATTAPATRLSADVQPLVAGANTFAVGVYSQLGAKEGNVFFSPISLHTALSMTAVGANGETLRQLAAVLYWPKDEPVANRATTPTTNPADTIAQPGYQQRTSIAYGEMLAALTPAKDAKYDLSIANALWGQKGYAWLPEFLKTTQDNYGAGLREVDFASPAEAAKIINGWVEKQTKDKIKDIVPASALDGLTRLVLTNAVYFKGLWASPFDKKLTQEGEFFPTVGKAVKAHMMTRTGKYWHLDNGTVQMLKLPYAGDELSMLILLPCQVDGLKELEEKMPERLNDWVRLMRYRQVQVTMPRFRVECSYAMNDALKAMGMKDAFASGAADFSGMDGQKDLYVSAVLHKAYVDVNEEGAEAAAATAVGIAANGHVSEEPEVFNVDQPFTFIIMHEKTGAILFMGRVSDPTK